MITLLTLLKAKHQCRSYSLKCNQNILADFELLGIPGGAYNSKTQSGGIGSFYFASHSRDRLQCEKKVGTPPQNFQYYLFPMLLSM